MKLDQIEPCESYTVLFEGHQLIYRAYFKEQTGNPIVFVHGLVASVDFFADENFRQMRALGPVYSIALPGHAPGKAVSQHFKTDERLLADAVAAQLHDFLKGRKATLIGHSTGATAALACAIHHPELVESVVVCDGSSRGRETNGIFRLLQWLVLRLGGLGTLIFKTIFRLNSYSLWTNKQFLVDLFADKSRMASYPFMDVTQRKYFPALQQLDLDVMKSMFADLDTVDLVPSLHLITVPVQVIIGDKDPYVPMDEALAIVKAIPHAQLHVIAGGGHLPFFETPEEFEATITGFVLSQRKVVTAA